MYAAKIISGAVAATYATPHEVRMAHPATAFPQSPGADDLAAVQCVLVVPTPQPSHDPLIERVVEEAPVLQQARNLDGTFKSDDPDTPDNEAWEWVQAWSVVPLSTEEAADRLQNAKQQLIRRINTKRDELEASGFNYLGKRLDSDERSVLRFNITVQAAQAAVAAGQPFSVDWTCADNTILPLDAAGVIGIPVTFAIYGNALHQHARALKLAVDAATTSTELGAIDIQEGWPT